MYSATITNNNAEGHGGGVYNLGEFTIHGGCISTNDAGSNRYGGGVYNGNGGTVTLDEGLIVDDNGALKGGGLYLQSGSTTILDSVFIQNNRLQMGRQGRGIYEQNGANLTETTVTDADDPGGLPVQGS